MRYYPIASYREHLYESRAAFREAAFLLAAHKLGLRVQEGVAADPLVVQSKVQGDTASREYAIASLAPFVMDQYVQELTGQNVGPSNADELMGEIGLRGGARSGATLIDWWNEAYRLVDTNFLRVKCVRDHLHHSKRLDRDTLLKLLKPARGHDCSCFRLKRSTKSK